MAAADMPDTAGSTWRGLAIPAARTGSGIGTISITATGVRMTETVAAAMFAGATANTPSRAVTANTSDHATVDSDRCSSRSSSITGQKKTVRTGRNQARTGKVHTVTVPMVTNATVTTSSRAVIANTSDRTVRGR